MVLVNSLSLNNGKTAFPGCAPAIKSGIQLFLTQFVMKNFAGNTNQKYLQVSMFRLMQRLVTKSVETLLVLFTFKSSSKYCHLYKILTAKVLLQYTPTYTIFGRSRNHPLLTDSVLRRVENYMTLSVLTPSLRNSRLL